MNSRHYISGIVGGIVGGLIFSIVLSVLNFLPAVALLVGSTSSVVGWFVTIVVGAVAGFTYAWWFGNRSNTYGNGFWYGLLHGFIWWVFGWLVLFPLMLGAGIQIGTALKSSNMFVLLGLLVYGLVNGVVFVLIDKPHIASHRRAHIHSV